MTYVIAKLTKSWKKLTAPIRREDGAVMMEAVIMMPLLAGFYCATVIWFDAYRQKTLVMKASYAVSDVLSRETEIDNQFLDDMRDVLDYMVPSQAAPKMRVSLIHYNANVANGANNYRLMWSYGPNDMAPLKQEDLDADVSWIPVMGDNDSVVVTETAMLYQPIFKVGIPKQIYRNTIVTRPRFAGTLTNSNYPPELYDNFDVDDDGDGDLVGNETDPDDGGDSDQADGHNGNST